MTTETVNILDMNEDELLAQFKARDRLIKALRQQLAESDTDTLRLLETIKYLVGIAEHGEERKLFDEETAEQFVLGYVKRIEKQLAECQAREKVLREFVEICIELDDYLTTTVIDALDKVRDLPSDSTALVAMLRDKYLAGLNAAQAETDSMKKQWQREALLEAVQHIRANGGLTYGLENKAKELE